MQAVVGVGVLGLPSALSHLTWVGGLALLALSAAVSLYTSYLLAALHESPDGKTRHNRRAERPWHLEGRRGRQSRSFTISCRLQPLAELCKCQRKSLRLLR